MPCLVILNQVEGFRVFDIEKEKVVIGRGDDADLMLPNISVSRHHAQILWSGETCSIEDLESSNGTLVNGKTVKGVVLASGDEILLGKFNLVFMGDGPDDRFYKGRYLEYMARYDAKARTFDDSTFAMSPAQLQQMQDEVNKMRNGRLVLASNPNRFWHPEDRQLTLGADAMVGVEGMFSSGVVAEVNWDGKNHVLNKLGRMIKVSINDSNVTSHSLRNGDRVRIGNTRFRYEVVND